MNRGLIFVIIFLLFSSVVSAAEFNLQASVNDKEVTLTWNNVFYGDEEDNTGDSLENPEKEEEIPKDDGSLTSPEEGSESLENPEEGGGDESSSNIGLTGGAVINQGFFSNVIEKISGFFKNIFKGKEVAGEVKSKGYILYKHPESESLSAKGEIISQGSLDEFNCDQICTYSYTEKEGKYRYSVASKIEEDIQEESSKTDLIEIKVLEEVSGGSAAGDFPIDEPECTTNEDCEGIKTCVDSECVIVYPACESDEECNEGEVCEENVCVTAPECAINEDCGESEECVEEICVCILDSIKTQSCNFDIGICQKSGTQTKTCSANTEGNNIWNEWTICSIEPECTTNEDCESGFCDLDISSCLPDEFEITEISCDNNLDDDCDGYSDCDDDDCDLDTYCDEDSGTNEGTQITQQTNEEENLGSRESSSRRSSSRTSGVASESSEQTPKSKGLGWTTWIIIIVVLLIAGIVVIYFYIFKIKKK